MNLFPRKNVMRKLGFFVVGILILGGLSSCSTLTQDQSNKLESKVKPYLDQINSDALIAQIIANVNWWYIWNLNQAGGATQEDIAAAANFQIDKEAIIDFQSYAAVDNLGVFGDAVDSFWGRMIAQYYNAHNNTMPPITTKQMDAYEKAIYQYFWDTRSIWAFLFTDDPEQTSSASAIDTRTLLTRQTVVAQQNSSPQPP